ncbi:MAG: DNA primase [Kiritimatiellae bacterium]|nr:DNA primase [Kiritimatiellia bacterium]
MGALIDSHVIEEIRARVDIVELIGSRMELKKAGSSFMGCCPFHNEKTPSFSVNPVRQYYHCFGCGVHGDVFKFLQEQDGLTFVDAVRVLADRAGVTIAEKYDQSAGSRKMLYALHAELAAFYQRCLLQSKGAAGARAYLEERKLDDKTVESFGIGYAPARPRNAVLKWAEKNARPVEQLIAAGIVLPPREGQRRDDYYDRFQSRLMFPICDTQGRVVAFSARVLEQGSKAAKYVNSPETDIFVKGRVLYGLNKAAAKIVKHPRREAIICEGQIDVIRCHAAGFETAVAAQGTAFSREHVKLLKRYADCVVIVFDGDLAGKKAAVRSGALLLEEEIPVRVAALPPGEDPDSIIRSRGYEGFKAILESARSITAFQIAFLREQEQAPDSIDAVSRVTHGVLETLAGCASAVLRSSLLQESADLLHLPLSALSDDLESLQAHISKRRHYAERPPAPPPVKAQAGSAADDEPPIPDLPPGPADDEDYDFNPEYAGMAGFEPIKPPNEAEMLLCEMLIEHEQEVPLLNLVINHLPYDLIIHPFAREVVRAIIEGCRSGRDMLADLYRKTEAELMPLFDDLLNHKHKMLCATEATPEEAVQDIIKRLWIIHYRSEQGGLPAESTSENDMQRLKLSCLIKELETGAWSRISQHMRIPEAAALTPSPCREPANSAELHDAEPSGYAVDNASAYSYPDEFQSSECPPDETLDL